MRKIINNIKESKSKPWAYFACSLFAIIIAFVSFNFNAFRVINKNYFYHFQEDSEMLVTAAIIANNRGIKIPNGFHLGGFPWNPMYDKRVYKNIDKALPDLHVTIVDKNDQDWTHGVNKARNALYLTPEARSKALNYIWRKLIINGKEYRIRQVNRSGDPWLDITDRMDIEPRPGLTAILSGEPIENSSMPIWAYRSQVGVQGMLFSSLNNFGMSIKGMYALNSLLLAFLVVGLCWGYRAVLPPIFSVCLYITMVLSPWLVPFARNLYWVAWTWFLPAFIVLLIIRTERTYLKFLLWSLVAVAICLKSLAGYEYLSSIILFAAAPYGLLLLGAKRKTDIIKLFSKFSLVCLLGAIGFFAALLIHANLRGDTIIEGLKNIYVGDVLRRTYGSADNFTHPLTAASLNASVWTVLKYYIFDGSRTWLYCLKISYAMIGAAVGLTLLKIHYEKIKHLIIPFIVFSSIPISWFILGKAHSFIHRHMNYVLWTFGFSAVCLWIWYETILKLIRLLKKRFFEQ